MASLDKLLDQYKKEIDSETAEFGEVFQTSVPRGSDRRPWHLNVIPFEPIASRFPHRLNLINLFQLVLRYWWAAILGAIIAAGSTKLYFNQLEPIYSSTAHLYAPDKLDTIINRLSLLTSQLEFASLPSDFKMPLSMITRRLHDDTAKNWVLMKMSDDQMLRPELPRLDPASVGVNTFYAAGTDLLVVEGRANDPKLAVRVTEFYWRYLEKELNSARHRYISKVEDWIAIRKTDLVDDIDTIKRNLQRSSSQLAANGGNPLRVRLTTDMADLEMKKMEFEKERTILQRFEVTRNFDDLAKATDSEIQQRLAIYRTLEEGDDEAAVYQEHLGDMETDIRGLVKRRLAQIETQLESNGLDRQRFGGDLKGLRAEDGREELASESLRDLQLRLRTLETQLNDLEKVKSQLKTDRSAGIISLDAVQIPTENPTSIRPRPQAVLICAMIAAIFGAVVGLLLASGILRKYLLNILRGFIQGAPLPEMG